MAGKRLSVILVALLLVAGTVSVGSAWSVTARRADASSNDLQTSQSGPSCRKCKRIVRKARRCKRQNNDSAKCKRAIRKARKCKRILRSEQCRKEEGGAGGAGGTPSPSPSGCPAYQPGEQGAGKPTSIVTDAATAEAPVEVKVEVGDGVPQSPTNESVYYNVQVDTSASESGLYVRFEFDDAEDMDLYLNHASGDEAAHAGGYNPAPVIPGETDGTGDGGHSEVGAEVLDGIRTADCVGYTVDMRPFQNTAGEKTLKFYLGEVKNDPK